MQNEIDPDKTARHLRISVPSPWIARFAHLAPSEAPVLDVAAGGGRHTRVFIENGYHVTAIDKNTRTLEALPNQKNLEIIACDMETDAPVFTQDGPLAGRKFGTIVVVNYLYRPLMAALLEALTPGGLLLYETFALGNEIYSKPRNPDHLLKSGELLAFAAPHMQIVAYEHGLVQNDDLPGVKQRLCAIKDLGSSHRDDGEPPAHRL